jgi:hypothetical protein
MYQEIMRKVKRPVERVFAKVRKPEFDVPYTDYNQLKQDGNWAIETASFCNRTCSFCPGSIDEEVFRRRFVESETGRKKLKMRIPFKKITSLLDEILEISTAPSPTILAFGLNEPYQDERIIDILQATKQRGITVYMVSNGDVLKTDPKLFKESFPYLDRLKLGIYNNPTTKEGKDRIKSKKAYFETEYERLAEECGCRPELEFSINSMDFTIPESFLPKGRSLKYPCYPNADGFRQISAFGDLSICCKDNSWAELGGVCLGNIFEKSLKDIIFSDRHLEVMNMLRNGERHKLFRCSTCFGAIGTISAADEISYWRSKLAGKNRQEELARQLNELNQKANIRGEEFDFSGSDFSYQLKKGVEIWDEQSQQWKPV